MTGPFICILIIDVYPKRGSLMSLSLVECQGFPMSENMRTLHCDWDM